MRSLRAGNLVNHGRLGPKGLFASGPVGLLRELQDLYLPASFVDVTWTIIKQAGSALHDQELQGRDSEMRCRDGPSASLVADADEAGSTPAPGCRALTRAAGLSPGASALAEGSPFSAANALHHRGG